LNLRNAVDIFGPLDDNFKNLIAADALTETDLIIDYETCFNAKKMMDYFLSIKKILAGYDPISNKILTGKNGKINLITNQEILFSFHTNIFHQEASVESKSQKNIHLDN
jgi:hypothetical protein